MWIGLTTAVLGLLIAAPLVALVHELGHAIAARPAGYRVSSFNVGRGPTLLRRQLVGGAVFTVRLFFFAGGSCVAIPPSPADSSTDVRRRALFHAGGVLAQGALALLLALLPWTWWLEAVRDFNVLVAVWNLIPWRVGSTASDGWWLWRRFTRGGIGALPMFARRRSAVRVFSHEARSGSPLGAWYGRLVLAWMDLLTGHDAAADARFSAGTGPPVSAPELDALHGVLTAEWHRQRGRPLAALAAVEALQEKGGVGWPPSLHDMRNLVDARVRADLDQPDQARVALAHLAGVDGVIGREAAVVSLELALGHADPDAIAIAAERVVDHGVSRGLDPALGVVALWRAGVVLGGREGGVFTRRASAAAGRLLAFAAPGDRVALARRLGAPAGVRPLAPRDAVDASA